MALHAETTISFPNRMEPPPACVCARRPERNASLVSTFAGSWRSIAVTSEHDEPLALFQNEGMTLQEAQACAATTTWMWFFRKLSRAESAFTLRFQYWERSSRTAGNGRVVCRRTEKMVPHLRRRISAGISPMTFLLRGRLAASLDRTGPSRLSTRKEEFAWALEVGREDNSGAGFNLGEYASSVPSGLVP